MVFGDSQLLRKQALHTEPEADPFAKVLNVNDPLYCKACEKLFSKDTVFKAHVLGKKHIQALKAKGKYKEAMTLESKASMKKKMEEKAKKEKRTREDDSDAKVEAKKAKEADEAVPKFLANYSSMSACVASLKGQKEEETRIAEATKKSLAAQEKEAANRGARNIKDDGLGPKAMPEDPMKQVVNTEWWKGTAHAQGPQAQVVNEEDRGKWICMSHKCVGYENPRMALKCGKCGAQRRLCQDGKQPNIKNTSGTYARRDQMRNPCAH
eukprot:TRINITY_DN773_c0_g2_i1.p1 TRINITY_DN773_c0_g2~~TRINITY_DN773_c0_g2_i1.p1  ORF type:complete len:267 (+),score=88.51 TRINITY_DN773_c0_g2_i1:175-975(+)